MKKYEIIKIINNKNNVDDYCLVIRQYWLWKAPSDSNYQNMFLFDLLDRFGKFRFGYICYENELEEI